MSINADRINPTDCGIHTFLDDLKNYKFQIPTFQREIVWDENNVKELWDSIYKFYPLGSILIWKTNIKLQNHRYVGGHKITDENLRIPEYQYILDGQQRTTALLTSLMGGKIEGKEDFDPTLYIDLTISDENTIDEENYKKRFLFWDEIDDRGGKFRANTGKKKKFDEGLIVKLIDVYKDFSKIEKKLNDTGYSEWDHPIREQLRRIKTVLDNYRIAFIELREIQIPQVCQIFERINQAGRPLNIFDIVVAKTFKESTTTKKGFYLRELIDDFKNNLNGNFANLDDLTILQILAVIIRKKIPDTSVMNISDRYLNEIKSEEIELVWEESKKSICKLFDFFENHLHLKGPNLIPYRYFYLTLAHYFYENRNIENELIKKYFWFYSFHNDDLLINTTDLWNHIEILSKNEFPTSNRFLIDRNKLRTSSYSSRGRLSRAILALLSNQEPRDWNIKDRLVISEVYYLLTDKPNLHHIFPTDFINKNPGVNKYNKNSLMNIIYLTQITNLQISNRNPIDYIEDYDNPEFRKIISNHLLPQELLEWAELDEMPNNALDIFIEKRIDLIIEKLKQKLDGVNFEVIDTMSQ